MPLKTYRRGQFTINYSVLEDGDITLLRYIMRDVIVYHLENDYSEAKITYWAYHPSFDEVPQGTGVPNYYCCVGGQKKWVRDANS